MTEKDIIVGLNSTEQSGGKLNQEWVEWLQGFPIGWTDCDV